MVISKHKTVIQWVTRHNKNNGDSRTALLLGDKKKIKAICTPYRAAYHTDMKSYVVWSEHPNPLCDTTLLLDIRAAQLRSVTEIVLMIDGYQLIKFEVDWRLTVNALISHFLST